MYGGQLFHDMNTLLHKGLLLIDDRSAYAGLYYVWNEYPGHRNRAAAQSMTAGT